jgi:hypothetical protein
MMFEEESKFMAPIRAANSQSWLFMLAVIRCYFVGTLAKH